MSFSTDFLWGAATSSYQIEGGAYEDGKGLNIWDIFSHDPGRIKDRYTGDVACDHYHLFKEDVRLMKELEIQAYRFSINWARILPAGTGKINEKGIQFYSELIDSLLDAGIEPFLTLYHWDLPYELHKRGGWLNEEIIKWFGEYAAVVSKYFSDRVTYFFTFNEPQCFIGNGYVNGGHAPGIRSTVRDTFQMAHNVLRAHGMGVRQMRENAVRDIKIGYAPTGSMSYPFSTKPDDIEAARRYMFQMPEAEDNWTWNVSWWSDPIFLGEYPEEGMKNFRAYLPDITKEDMKLISQPIDFYGQNIYNGNRVRMGKSGKPEVVLRSEGFPKTALGWPVTPESMYWGTKYLYERYKTPIYITENGVSCCDAVSVDGKVHDYPRIDFMMKYLGQLKKAVQDEIDIRGYFHWSLLDNFEWSQGYNEKFGLIFVDFQTQRRIIKDSGYWYRELIRKNGENIKDENIK